MTNDVIFRVNDVQAVIGAGIGDPFGSVKRGVQTGPAVTGISTLSGSGNALQPSGVEIQFEYRVAFTQHQIGIPSLSQSMDLGPSSGVPDNAALSGVAVRSPVPDKVEIMPV